MAKTESKSYDPASAEKRIFEMWERGGCFRAGPDDGRERKTPFCMVIPPPNVTGALHLGHALIEKCLSFGALGSDLEIDLPLAVENLGRQCRSYRTGRWSTSVSLRSRRGLLRCERKDSQQGAQHMRTILARLPEKVSRLRAYRTVPTQARCQIQL